jgi:hypothetical protein
MIGRIGFFSFIYTSGMPLFQGTGPFPWPREFLKDACALTIKGQVFPCELP